MLDKEKIIALRLKGYSYNEIKKEFNISKSTLSILLKDVILSEEAKKRLKSRVAQGTLTGLVRRNRLQTIRAQERTKKIRALALKEIKNCDENDLKLIGTALYWAEGYKRIKIRGGRRITSHSISFTNSDPGMISAFLYFLRVTMKIPEENIKAHIRLHSHLDENIALNFWSKITGLPLSGFMKSTIVISRSSMGKRPFNRLPVGTIQITVARTNEFYKLMGWLDGMRKSLASMAKKA